MVMHREQAVLRFWRACEMFSPQPIPKVDRRRVSPVTRTTKSPRTSGSRSGKPVAYEWRHTVYLWVFPLEQLYLALDRVFPFDTESSDPRPGGESALASVVVDQDGFLLADSPVLSACGWATGIVGRHGGRVDRLDGLDSAQQTWLGQVSDIVVEHADGSEHPRPLDAATVQDLAQMTADFTRFPNLVGAGAIRIMSQQVRADGAGDPQGDFLNSFFLHDLSAVAAAAGVSPATRRAERLGRPLSRYLTDRADVRLEERVDVRHDLASVVRVTGPRRMPDGRWPSDPNHPLALSQQLAVNQIDRDADHGLFAVTGPPGTGKTTMLRDLVAARVVERAHRLATLAQPADGFGPALPSWRSGDYPRTVHPPVAELTGFELVLASSNNAAVANVSNEIPALDAIEDCYDGRVDYFTDIATALLQPAKIDAHADRDPDDEDDDDSVAHLADTPDRKRVGWALTAARLGNKRNRTTFMTRFWIGDKSLDRPYEAMQPLLRRWRSEPDDGSAWSEAVAAFRRALTAEQVAVAARDQVAVALDQLARSTRELATARERQQRTAEEARSLAAEVKRLDAARADAQEELAALDTLEQSLRPPRPGWLDNLLTLGRARRDWATTGVLPPEETERRRLAMATLDDLTSTRDRVNESFQAIGPVLDDLQRAIDDHQLVLDEATRVLDDAPSGWGDAVPLPGWWDNDVERREKTGPWLDRELNDLRVQVLFAALALHRAFVRANAATVETSLRAALDVVTGAAPAEVPAATRLAAWQVLFLVVPLVSTTFASVSRMFTDLPPGGLGWLLIDEAGQSAPQVAVGAMWRAKNVVVVGDPRQLQPVVTITPRLEGALARAYGVDEKWRPLTTSVQAVADEVARWGTWLAPTTDEPELWIGAPLRVHRRCDQPMLDICNEIAYPVRGPADDGGGSVADAPRGLMIGGVPSDRDVLPLPRSRWYDVPTTSSRGHFVPAELALLRDLLDRVLQTGVPLHQIICVSPFRDTADRLRALADLYGSTFRGGTIHTAQGQEADVVFLVLRGDPSKPGAKRWASRIPNLVNVAVSRARRRLYVIGDQSAWSHFPYFDVVSARLDHHADHEDDGDLIAVRSGPAGW